MAMERDLSLADRKVDTKPSRDVIVFRIDDIDRHFQESLDLIQKQLNCIDDISALDECVAEEVLRAQIVALDSAFDFYLHEVIKFGIVAIYHRDNGFLPTKKYNNLPVQMTYIEDAIAQHPDDTWLKDWIDVTYSWKPYMSYESFKEVCHLIDVGVSRVSDAIYQRGKGIDPIQELRSAIDNLYDHRNRIAHQSDRQSENAVRCVITKDTVETYIRNIKGIVSEMSKQIKEKQSGVDGQSSEEEKTDDEP